MTKKVLAVLLTGILTLGSSFAVLAEDAATETTTVIEEAAAEETVAEEAAAEETVAEEAAAGETVAEEESLDDLLNGLLGELGEAGADTEGLDKALGGLLSSLGGEAGTALDGILGLVENGEEGLTKVFEKIGNLFDSLVAALKDAGGSLNIDSLIKSLGLDTIFGEGGAVKELLGSLFTKDGIGTQFLNAIGAADSKIAGIIDSMKGEDGGFDYNKTEEVLGSIAEGATEDVLMISGEEITEEELNAAVEKALESLELDEAAADETAEEATEAPAEEATEAAAEETVDEAADEAATEEATAEADA